MEKHEVNTIIDKLKRGDGKLIAEMVGCPHQTVLSIKCGIRSYDTPVGRRIIQAAQRIVSQREQLIKEFQDEQ